VRVDVARGHLQTQNEHMAMAKLRLLSEWHVSAVRIVSENANDVFKSGGTVLLAGVD
jgi:hypothetical protein